ncbi:MAG: radical SAM protein [Armatimonadetes bacterium]|nr:radical SAM protein [Armatimonadota bacterium]
MEVKPGVDPLRVALIFPPQWTPLNPHFTLAKLGSHLRARGAQIRLFDLNVELYRHVLTPRYLAYARDRAARCRSLLQGRAFLALRRGDRSLQAAMDAARLLEIEKYLDTRPQVWNQVHDQLEEAVSVFDDREKFYDPYQLVRAYVTLDKALELASLPCYPARLSFNDYHTPCWPLTMESLLEATQDRDRNMSILFYQTRIPAILETRPNLIGISINAHSQIIPGLTLARMLKHRLRGSPCHVTLGGNYFLRVKEAILKHPEFLQTFADSIVVGEGEKPLDGLLEALRTGRTPEGIPGVIQDGGNGLPTLEQATKPYPMVEDGLPELAGLSLSSYFSPDLVLSVRTSKGCYWQKCTFCDTDYGICPDIKSTRQLVGEVAHLCKRYGIENFCFIDEAIRPKYMELFSQQLAERGLKVHWYGNGRTEKSFTRERLEKLAQGGLTMLMWGLESGSRRVMGLINKGVDLEGRMGILSDASSAGIWNFAYVFFGFPSETDEEAMETIRMLRDHRDIIHSYGRSIFSLGKHTQLRERAASLGVVERMADREEFSTTLEYTTRGGNERQRAIARADLCKRTCADAQGEPLWMYLRYREVIHLYLKEYGRDFVERFRFSPDRRETLHRMFQPEEVFAGADNP